MDYKKCFPKYCTVEFRDFEYSVGQDISFRREKDRITYFAINLRVLVGGKWQVVGRWDTSHGHPHLDKKGEKIAIEADDYKKLFNKLMDMLEQERENIVRGYLQRRWENGRLKNG